MTQPKDPRHLLPLPEGDSSMCPSRASMSRGVGRAGQGRAGHGALLD